MKFTIAGVFATILLTAIWLCIPDRGLKPLKTMPAPHGKYNQPYPGDWMLRQRAYPHDMVNPAAVTRGLKQARKLRAEIPLSKNAVSWEMAAQTSVPGRVIHLAQGAGNRIFAGTPSGGLWRSQDEGASWQAVFDDMPSLSIGGIAAAPSSPNVLYVGTGSGNGSYNSVLYPGAGVFKSTDSGDSWTPVGLEATRFIGRVVVHPTNPDIVFVAAMGPIQFESADRGLYRSKDGGLHWEKVLFVNEATGCIDVAIDPNNPNRLYAATWQRQRSKFGREYTGPGSALWRSDDGGESWTAMANGLPEQGDLGRMGLAIAPSSPNILYAVGSDKDHELEGVYKSVDSGDSWTKINTGNMSGMYSGFGWYFCNVRVHPKNPDKVFVMGVRLFQSEDGGTSWRQYDNTVPVQLRNDPDYQVHVDYHDLIFTGEDGEIGYVANDGGVYRSEGEAILWKAVGTPPDAQFYTAEIDPNSPDRVFGGLQDNGVQFNNAGSTSPWTFIFGGDGMQIQVHPENSLSIFMESQWGFLYHAYNWEYYPVYEELDENDRFEWNTPILLDPTDPNTLYVGSQRLWRASDIQPGVYDFRPISGDLSKGGIPGSTSAGAITAFDVAASDSNVIIAGTNDGNAWATSDGGENWRQLSGLPDRWVTGVAVDPQDPNTAYITFSGYYDVDYQPHIMMTRDQGAIWTDISGNLPEAPINDVVIDPVNRDILYIASEYGVYYSLNRGESWRPLGVGLPMITVSDLDLHAASGKLAAATFGRSMYVIDLNRIRTEEGPRGTTKPHRYAITEISKGAPERTYISLINPGAQSTGIELVAFSSQGFELQEIQLTLDPLEKQTISTNEQFPGLEVAWVQVGSDEPVSVMAHATAPGVSSAWWASDGADSLVYMPHIAKNTGLFETRINSANSTGNSLLHSVTANLDGPASLIKDHQIPYSQISRDARQYLGANLETVDFAILQADQPGAASMESFVTLPERDRKAALGLTGQKGKTLRFLHIAENNQLFWTGMVYINVDGEAATAQERYYDKNGNLLNARSVDLASGQKITLLRDHIGSDVVPEGSAWMEVIADKNLIGYELFGSALVVDNDFFAGLQGHYQGGSLLDYPHFVGNDQQWTGLVAVNLGDAPATATFTVYNESGQPLESKTVENLPARAKTTVLVNDEFSADTLANGAWVRMDGGSGSWAGFQLWGDHNGPKRSNMAGLNAVIVPSLK